MRTAFLFLSLVAFGYGVPTPRALFHEHYDDFLNVIIEEVGEELNEIVEHYLEFEDFWVSLNYLQTQNFKDLVSEMESLPEFNDVIDFLENDNIDINYFLDNIHQLLDSIDTRKRSKSARHELSGTDFNSYLKDIIATFPKDKLAALYDKKIEEDEEFRVAIENLKSDEWEQTVNALFDNETFRKEIDTLAENGVDFHLVVEQFLAVFGQL